jgi:hypothetical protein
MATATIEMNPTAVAVVMRLPGLSNGIPRAIYSEQS